MMVDKLVSSMVENLATTMDASLVDMMVYKKENKLAKKLDVK